MKAIATLAAAAALLTLPACDRFGIGGGAASNAAGNQAGNSAGGNKDSPAGTAAASGGKDPAGAVPASTTGAVTLDRAYISGRWTDDGDCAAAAEFNIDGTFATADGGGGLWNLEGDRLTMSGAGGTNTLRIVPIDQNTMNVVNADGSLGRSTRC
jgi:hypothetical protein